MSHGPVMLDLLGTQLSDDERELLKHPATGGVILFRRNYQSPEQLRDLVDSIHALRQPSLLVAVDQEGGRVQRFQEGFTQLPPAAWYGGLWDEMGRDCLPRVREMGWLMAAELRSCGVDFSFAPVLDLDRGLGSVIGDRAMHREPLVTAALAEAWVLGVREAGMAAVGKHFPGHGGVAEDSHQELPVDDRSLDQLLIDDLIPFQRLIEHQLEAIMPAHLVYRHCDPLPAGFSPFWLQQILRRRFGFQGVIFSDDLSMAAADVGGSHPERARKALAAGCDMVLVCNDQPQAGRVLHALRDHQDPVAQTRLVRMHGHRRFNRHQLHRERRWKQALRIAEHYTESLERELDLQVCDPTAPSAVKQVH